MLGDPVRSVTPDGPAAMDLRREYIQAPRKWGQSLLRFPGWHDIGAGARVWDAGTDPDWPDHTHPFVD